MVRYPSGYRSAVVAACWPGHSNAIHLLSRLAHYPRYMKALQQRLERLAGQYPKDQKYTASLQALTQPLLAGIAGAPGTAIAEC